MTEETVLKTIADNPRMGDILLRLFEHEFETPLLEIEDLPNAELGERVRARLMGLKAVHAVFRKIEQHKTPNEAGEAVNPAR